jgi:hypothetical protein
VHQLHMTLPPHRQSSSPHQPSMSQSALLGIPCAGVLGASCSR